MTSSSVLPTQGSRHLLAIDANDFIRRAWHGHVNDKRHEPERVAPTALRAIARLLRGQQPSHVAAATEGVGSVRKDRYAEYKGNRPPKPDGLLFVEGQVASALRNAWIPLCSFAGLEADDALHAMTLVARKAQLPIVIVSHDKDLMYLASAEHCVVILAGDKAFDEYLISEEWGVAPRRIPDILALAGDDADNIPHVKGWGPATAKKILGSFSLESLLGPNGDWDVPEKYRKAFRNNRDMIRLATELIALRGESITHKIDVDEFECHALSAAESLMDSADSIGRDGVW